MSKSTRNGPVTNTEYNICPFGLKGSVALENHLSSI